MVTAVGTEAERIWDDAGHPIRRVALPEPITGATNRLRPDRSRSDATPSSRSGPSVVRSSATARASVAITNWSACPSLARTLLLASGAGGSLACQLSIQVIDQLGRRLPVVVQEGIDDLLQQAEHD